MIRSENLRGMMLMTAAMAGFASADAVIKVLSATHPQGQMIWVVGLAGSLVFALLVLAGGQPVLSRDLGRPAVIARVATEAGGTIGIVMALSLAPLSVVVAIMQSVPLLVTLGAALFLGEKVGLRRWLAISVGLAGVLLILRPGTEGFSIGALFAAIAAILLSSRDLLTRLVPHTASNLQLGCWGFAGLVPAGLLLGAISGAPPGPLDPPALALFAGITALTVGAIYGITGAMRLGDVAVVAPFRYTRLIFGLMLAILFFGERPDLATWAGAAIVAGSGLYTFYRERKVLREQPG